MRLIKFGRSLTAVSVFLLLQGCFVEITPQSASTTSGGTQVTTINGSSTLSCAASVPAGTIVYSGTPVNITVTATGGIAPYQFPGQSNTFSSTGSLPRTYSNLTSGSIVVGDQLTIQDSQGEQSTCTLSVTVQPESAPPATLACSLTSSATTVAINSPDNYTAVSSGGVGTRTFSAFTPGTGGNITIPFNPSSGTAQVTYGSPGQKTTSVTVRDSSNNVASCSSTITVSPAPALTISVTPSTTQPTASLFTLTAIPTGFVNAPTSYQFTPSVSGVTLLQDSTASPTAQAYSTTVNSFRITVTASNANETASSSVDLNYTSSALICTLSHNAGTYYPNETVTFTATSNTGEALVIYDASAQDGTGYYLNSSAYISFFNSGMKGVSVRARGAASGKLCNNGSYLQDSILISSRTPALSCTASTNINPAYSGQSFRATVVPSANSSGTVGITSIGLDPRAQGNYTVAPNGLQATLVIYGRGNYSVTYNIFDFRSGASASCTSVQTIQ